MDKPEPEPEPELEAMCNKWLSGILHNRGFKITPFPKPLPLNMLIRKKIHTRWPYPAGSSRLGL